MSRLTPISHDAATGKAKDLLGAVKQSMGATPNIFTAFANAPSAMEGYLSFNGALSTGALEPQLREKIALTTAALNKCQYCASAHTYLGEKAGIEAVEMTQNLSGKSSDTKTEAALTFARKIITHRGQIEEADIQAVRDAGFGTEEIIEILAHVALNTFTNYFNEVFKVEIDFPVVDLVQKSDAA